jgi:hypothetical protein
MRVTPHHDRLSESVYPLIAVCITVKKPFRPREKNGNNAMIMKKETHR